VPRVEEDLLAEPDADPRDGFRRSEGAFPPSSTGERRRSGGGGDPEGWFSSLRRGVSSLLNGCHGVRWRHGLADGPRR
jgi:hypothetical protein